jgi:hypothetical protein
VPTDSNFLTRKLGPLPMWVWIGAGVAVAYWYYSRQQAAAASSASTASSPLTSTAALQAANGASYGTGYAGSDIADQLAQLTSMLGAGNAGTTSTPAVSPGNTTTNINIGAIPGATTSAAASTGVAPSGLPANPYPVGRTVAPGETITQAVWDPIAKTWIDVTSKGGAYTSRGLPLSGSAYGKGTGAWTLAGTPGQTFTEVLNGHSYTYSIK